MELTTEEKLMQLQTRALSDDSLREKLLATKNDADPLGKFCAVCNENGCDVTLWELADGGQEFCDAMLRSVNGGGVEAPDGWNDYYEMFLEAISR